MVLQNNVILQNNIPCRLHFTDHHLLPRTITDPDSGRPGIRNVLEFDVDTLDGRPVGAKFSTMAEKLASQFKPYLDDKSYRNYDFIITQRGEGYLRTWTVQVIPRTTR
jgi:hypothetical protein